MISIGGRLLTGLPSSALVTAVLLRAALALALANPAHAAFPGASGQIVFVSDRDGFGNPEIYVMNADGTSPTRLTNNPANDYTPAWSPDGTRIVFGSNRDHFAGELYVMNADGSGQTRLTTNTAQEREPTWSPNGNQITFTSTRDGNDEIYVMNADGSGQTRLTNNAASDDDPAWSPDGTRIAFVSNRDGNFEVHVMGTDGSNPVQLTNTFLQSYSDPAWSPDGSRLAFDNGTGQIFVMNANGTGGQQYTTPPGSNFMPAWSPDGRYIAIHSSRDGNAEIYLIDSTFDGDTPIRLTTTAVSVSDVEPDWQPIRLPGKLAFQSNSDVMLLKFNGTPPIILTNQIGADGGSPAWSPLGTQIVFQSYRDLIGAEIYTMNADGSGQTQLTDNSIDPFHPVDDTFPAWSPDGTKIAFATQRDVVGLNTFSEIYVMNANGTSPTRLTNNSGFLIDVAPAWSPDGTRIAYYAYSLGGSLGISVMNADGSSVTLLTNGSGDFDPAWSPDGTKIAFERLGDIFTMNTNGTGQTPLTISPGFDNREPTWSPDGAWIAFTSNRDGENEIYAMRADGSTQIRLTNDNGDYSQPAWQLGTDTDGDGAPNVADNCTLVSNPSQLDANGDGYGNLCDADLNNSGLVTTGDFGLLRSVLGQPASFSPLAAAADLNGSGTVTTADFGMLRTQLGTPPGPSGVAP